jgi:Caspase domain/Sel1 repeat
MLLRSLFWAWALWTLSLNVGAQPTITTPLPCSGTDVKTWHQCVGETQLMVDESPRTYRGEFENGLPHGRGVRFGYGYEKDKDGHLVQTKLPDGRLLEIKTVGFFKEGNVHGFGQTTRTDGTGFKGEYKQGKFLKGEKKYLITYTNKTGFFTSESKTEMMTYIGTLNEKDQRDGNGVLYDENNELVFCGKFINNAPQYETNREYQIKNLKTCEDFFKSDWNRRLLTNLNALQQDEVPKIEALINQSLALRSRLAQPAAKLINPLGNGYPNCSHADLVLKSNDQTMRDQSNPILFKMRGLAMSQMAYLYLLGCPAQVKVDLEEALYWMDLAVKAREPSAIHNLAWMYQNGLGVPRDDRRAASLYRTVADSDERTPTQRRAARENLALISPDIVQAATPLDVPVEAATTALVATTPASAPAAMPMAVAMPASNSDLTAGVTTKPDSAPIASSGKRRALVMGNDAYQKVQPLANAREDARAIAEQFRAMGYDVTLALDQNERAMKRTLRTFSDQVQGGDEVIFFFAGHGVQLGPANYLLPVDISGESEGQVRDESIPLQRVLDEFADRRAKFTMAIIDACRDNPFKSAGRSIGGRGLAATTAATGQMVIFSAGVGQQALDRLGPNDRSRNGLFTRVFLKEIQKPGLSVDKVVRNVRNEVVETARKNGHEQVPAIYDQVVGEFFFRR